MSSKFRIIDTTLRDGAQTPGLSFTLSEKLEICEGLARIGVPELETGIPAMSVEERSDLQIIANYGFPFEQLLWCRCTLQDLELAAPIGARGVHISIPCSPIHEKSMGITFQRHMEKFESMLRFAHGHFDKVCVGFQDASRTSSGRLIELAAHCELHNVDRIRFADTVGILSPTEVSKELKRLQKYFCGEIEFHAHNDLGMATANAWVALQNGCSVSTTLLGLGERAGNTSLEEIVMALYTKESDRSFSIQHLTPLCERVAEISQYSIAPNKPILGANINTHESGIHCSAQINDPASYQALPTHELSKECRIVFGTHSGKNAIAHLAKSHDIQVDASKLDSVLIKVKECSQKFRRFLSTEEVLVFLRCLILILPILSVSCNSESIAKTRIYAASSLNPVMESIIQIEPSLTKKNAQLNVASSGTLARQILAGAPADLYLSANKKWAKRILEMEEYQSSCVFLKNRMVLLQASHLNKADTVQKNSVLKPKGLLVMGDADHVPAGQYAQEVLTSLNWNSLPDLKIISTVSVRQAVMSIEEGHSDYAMVYASDTIGLKHSSALRIFSEDLHSSIEYFAVLRKNSTAESQYVWRQLCHGKFEAEFHKFGFQSNFEIAKNISVETGGL